MWDVRAAIHLNVTSCCSAANVGGYRGWGAVRNGTPPAAVCDLTHVAPCKRGYAGAGSYATIAATASSTLTLEVVGR